MEDYKAPIIYLSGEEMESFSNQSETAVLGHSYEWEGERVVHLHVHPVLHSYGAQGKVMFSKSSIENYDSSQLTGVSYFVYDNVDSIEVFECIEGKWQKRDVNFIPSHQELYSRNKGSNYSAPPQHKIVNGTR